MIVLYKYIYISKIDVALNGGQFGDENIIVGDTPFQSTLVSYMRYILCISH